MKRSTRQAPKPVWPSLISGKAERCCCAEMRRPQRKKSMSPNATIAPAETNRDSLPPPRRAGELATIEKDQEGAERRGKEIADPRKELGLPPGPMLPNIREPSNPASRMTLLLRAAPITALREARLDAFEGEIPPVAARSTPDRP